MDRIPLEMLRSSVICSIPAIAQCQWLLPVCKQGRPSPILVPRELTAPAISRKVHVMHALSEVEASAMRRAGLTELRRQGRDLVGMVQYGGERVVLEHFGRPVAALVSLEDLAVLERLEDQGLVELADQSEAEPGPDIPWDQVKAESESLR
jgi:antitoxin (DNA-binding transcriptional repressor) of toxin-antitoxin stability system